MKLDEVLPYPRYTIEQSRWIDAPPELVWGELHSVTLGSLPLSRALMAARYLPARLTGRAQPLGPRTSLDATPIPVVHSDRPIELVLAGVTQPWKLRGGDTPPELDARDFFRFSEPGWVKVAMNFQLQIDDAGCTSIRAATRMRATDAATQRKFAPYWLAIRGSSAAIRKELLDVVAKRAAHAAGRG
jgi:hypothetical protein